MEKNKKNGLVGGITLGVILILVLIALKISLVKVPAGYVAVQYSASGGVKDTVLTQGWHLKSPMVKTTLYSVGLEQSYLTAEKKGDSPDDESFVASSIEGKALTIDLTYTYQYQSENVVAVFNRFKGQSGTSVRDSFVKPNIISWTKEVIARYKVSDILGEKKAAVNGEITKYLSEKFNTYGITISNVSLINITVDKNTQKAINAKITAQQNAETQAINNQTAIDKAEADKKVAVTQAQAEADKKKIAAEAEAEAIHIQAEAEAEANAKISKSLSDKLIENNKIEKWNGQLPTYSGEGMSMILNGTSSSK